MTRLFLDTEFNGFGGELISLALVAEDGREWYGVRTVTPAAPHPFVASHVLPVLAHYCPEPFTLPSLHDFIAGYPGAEFIADWPADFQHLAECMAAIGKRYDFTLPLECTMRLVDSPPLHPEVPHNALSDARALRDWYLEATKLKSVFTLQEIQDAHEEEPGLGVSYKGCHTVAG